MWTQEESLRREFKSIKETFSLSFIELTPLCFMSQIRMIHGGTTSGLHQGVGRVGIYAYKVGLHERIRVLKVEQAKLKGLFVVFL